MKNILITGSVQNSNEESKKIYEDLVNLCLANNFNVSSPLDTMLFTGNDKERYQRALSLVESSNFMIAEMSIPSVGQGMELMHAINNNLPILIIAKNNSKISGLIKGSQKVLDILYYDVIDDIKDKITEIILNN